MATVRVELDFDFLDHTLVARVSDGCMRALPLEPRSVAAFYSEVRALLDELDVDVRIWPMPVEIPEPIPFGADTQPLQLRRATPRAASSRCCAAPTWRSRPYRSGFSGKSSPVHFFWGSFDLGGHALLRAAGAAARGRRPHHARRVQRRGHERRLLARQRRRRCRLLRLCRARAGAASARRASAARRPTTTRR